MINPVFKAAGMGVFAGWILFAFPFFILKSFIFILLFGMMFRMFAGWRFSGSYGPGYRCGEGGSMRQRFHNMTEEEKKEFFSKMKHHRCHRHRSETDEEGFVKPINK